MLLESRFEFLQPKFLPLMVAALASETLTIPPSIAAHLDLAKPVGRCNATELADALFNYVFAVDPDPVKKNAQWLLTIIMRKNNPMPLEDLEYAGETLTKFAEMKKSRALPPKTDINRFKSLSELNAAMRGEQEHATTALASEEQTMLKQTNVLYDGPDYRVLSPLTKAAACYFGRDTEWCTAWGNHLEMGLSQQGRQPTRTNLFDTYVKQGPLYIVWDKTNNKLWQLSFAAGQFMDVNDRSIDLDRFMTEHNYRKNASALLISCELTQAINFSNR
jgi:hypothetical protein